MQKIENKINFSHTYFWGFEYDKNVEPFIYIIYVKNHIRFV